MKSVSVAFFIAVIVACPASALDGRDLALCSSIEQAERRLACFDTLAKKASAVELEPTKVPILSKWEMSEEVSPIDDSKTVNIVVNSDTLVENKFGSSSYPVLFLRCKEKKTDAYIALDSFIGSSGTDVTTRLDKQKAEIKEWDISTAHKSVFAPKPVDFIKRLMKAETLFVQLTPYGENPVSFTFSVTGLADKIRPLQDSCGWR